MRNKMMAAALAGALTFGTAGGSALALDHHGMKMDAEAQAEAFVKSAAHSGHFEIESSQLALEKSRNDQVRSYAQNMIEDHKRMNAKLKDVAEMDVPSKPGAPQRLIVAKLSGMDGTAFDRAYIENQIVGHKLTVSFFEQMAMNGETEELREYADMALPLLERHLRNAEEIARDMGVM